MPHPTHWPSHLLLLLLGEHKLKMKEWSFRWLASHSFWHCKRELWSSLDDNDIVSGNSSKNSLRTLSNDFLGFAGPMRSLFWSGLSTWIYPRNTSYNPRNEQYRPPSCSGLNMNSQFRIAAKISPSENWKELLHQIDHNFRNLMMNFESALTW